ncbi:hypothetical protein Tco_0128780 [Tanacetum coccineum]
MIVTNRFTLIVLSALRRSDKENRQVGPYESGGASKDGDGDTSFQWSQFTTQCSHLMFPKDIQCAGSDTRPPMLDKTDFASWQQRIRLYCQGKMETQSSVRSNVNTVRPKQPVPTSNSNSFSPVRPQVNKFNQRSNFSKSHSPVRRPIVRNTAKMPYSHAVKGNWGTAIKTSAGYNWRNTRPNSNCNSGSNFVQTVNAKGPQGRPKPENA